MSTARASNTKRSAPYVPSYLNVSGPEPCVVCGDNATGFHYRCMTCEGCKGFFRRSTQKGLLPTYICKGNGNCVIDKSSRNQCPWCRYQKCVRLGMAVDLVLNDHQRVAKRQLIEENRERRKMDAIRTKIIHEVLEDKLTNPDRVLIKEVLAVYKSVLAPRPVALDGEAGQTGPKKVKARNPIIKLEDGTGSLSKVADLMTPAITRLIEFSQKIPGFRSLLAADQIVLLKASCLEIMILRTAIRYDPATASIVFNGGLQVNQYYFGSGSGNGQYDVLMRPTFSFAVSLARIFPDETEVALLMGLLLLTERNGLTDVPAVWKLEETLLGALRRYVCETHGHEANRFSRLMVKLLELRTICSQNSEQILCMKLDGMHNGPAVLFETMFYDENWKSLSA